MLSEGTGVAKNPAEAFRWRLKAANHAKADGYDLLALARVYDQGFGTPRDPEKALAALRIAKGKRIDDSDTTTSEEMQKFEARLVAEVQ